MNVTNQKNLTDQNPAPNSTHQYPYEKGMRVDSFLAAQYEAYSRTFFQQLIDQNHVRVNSILVKKPSALLKKNDCVTAYFPPFELRKDAKTLDSSLIISKIYEHEQFLILSKPPHLSVHAPSKQTEEASLVDWLITHFQELRSVGPADRPGIVHRLDKDTSGLLLIARNRYSHERFSDMFKNRLIQKTYLALVVGHPEKSGTIDFPISRDRLHRIKMSHHSSSGRAALTHYEVLEYYNNASLVALKPTTGRTHQLRVHCAALGHPIIGDYLYGTSSKLIKRQALHASRLAFSFDNQDFIFEQEPPADFQELRSLLQKM